MDTEDTLFGVFIGSLIGALIMGLLITACLSSKYNKIVINHQECYEIEEKIYCEWSEE